MPTKRDSTFRQIRFPFIGSSKTASSVFRCWRFIELMMAESALLTGIRPRQISFQHCLQLWLSWASNLVKEEPEQLSILFSLMAQQCVGKRPGRIEPRAVKRRPKAYPLLRKPRQEARQRVLDFGHPKKLKSVPCYSDPHYLCF